MKYVLALTPKGPLSRYGFFENSGRFLRAQFRSEFSEFFCGCGELEELCGNVNFFHTGHWEKKLCCPELKNGDVGQLEFFCYTPLLLLRFGTEVTNMIIFEITKKKNSPQCKNFTPTGVKVCQFCFLPPKNTRLANFDSSWSERFALWRVFFFFAVSKMIMIVTYVPNLRRSRGA